MWGWGCCEGCGGSAGWAAGPVPCEQRRVEVGDETGLWPVQSRALCWLSGLCTEGEQEKGVVVAPGEDQLLKQPGESRAGTRLEDQLHNQPRPREAHGLQGLLALELGWELPAQVSV